MQTFLPHPNFDDALAVLDTPRLGKQRVETLQILRALVLPEYGWRNHPAVRMWQGHLAALTVYGLASVRHWERRGFADSTAHQIAEFAPESVDATQADLAAAGLLPTWLGDRRLHRSHQSKLLSKDPAHYGKYFPDVPVDLEYFWPDPDELPPSSSPIGRDLWVVQPDSPQALGQFVRDGIVSVANGSGVDVDATGQDIAGLRHLLGPAGRRNSRAVAALARWSGDVQVGDQLAVPIDNGTSLLLGEVVGDYEFVARATPLGQHRRRVRWDRLLPRSAVHPVATMQDVRPLFRVVIDVHSPTACTP